MSTLMVLQAVIATQHPQLLEGSTDAQRMQAARCMRHVLTLYVTDGTNIYVDSKLHVALVQDLLSFAVVGATVHQWTISTLSSPSRSANNAVAICCEVS